MWLYDNKKFNTEDIGENYGFVYRITNLTNNHFYIGRKFFWTIKKRPPLKGKKNKRHEKVETDWKDYFGSSVALQKDIDHWGEDHFKREIIYLCKTRGETNYREAKVQFDENVLLRKDCYNGIISVRIGGNSVRHLTS